MALMGKRWESVRGERLVDADGNVTAFLYKGQPVAWVDLVRRTANRFWKHPGYQVAAGIW